MKKIRIAAMALLLASVVCSAQTRWGLPYNVDISAYAINDYSHNGNSNLNRSIIHKNRFIEQIQGKLRSRYPSVSSVVRHNRENSAATTNNFRLNDNTDISEFVFFSGHGNKNKLAFYNESMYLNSIFIFNGTVYPTIYKNFGGSYTRWVILDACLTLSASEIERFFWFNGAHSVLGSRSISWEFPGSPPSERQFDRFASLFITDGETIWISYALAVIETIYQHGGGIGIEPAIAYVKGYADNGQYANFSEERLQNTYNGPFHHLNGASSNSFTTTWNSLVYGNPQY